MKKGFTLSETLLTLVIIGVIAALVMPTVVNNIREKQYIAAYKRIYGEISEIMNRLEDDYSGSAFLRCGDYDDVCFKNLFVNEMTVLKECYNTQVPNDCQGFSKYRNGSPQFGTINANAKIFRLLLLQADTPLNFVSTEKNFRDILKIPI